MSRTILVAVAWPYASGSRHLGHLAGAYLPADIFARYHRLAGNRVLMVSGSDVHGTPITFRADEEGVTPEEIVDRYHSEFLRNWESLGISWDLYTTTGTEIHRDVTWDIFRTLREGGYIFPAESQQFYDPEAGRFLPDRYIGGTCPHCSYPKARGDQCENCGRTLDPGDLKDPVSRLSGATPVMRTTQHYLLRLGSFAVALEEWLRTREGWRKHVQNWALGMVAEGLPDRAITRDLDWGVPIPPEADTLGEGKRIYVWFEAVIGYLSASKEWAWRQGTPEAWRDWWQVPEAESYYFVGKDNIPFHTVIWPAMLMGYGSHNLPTDVPANQFITFRGEKGSSSAGVGRSITWYTERFEPDSLRYALSAVLPEQNDTDLSDDEIVRRINEELVATWGNLVNRVLTIVERDFGGVLPSRTEEVPEDVELLDQIEAALTEAGSLIEAVELRAGLRRIMEAATAANAYLNAQAPWRLIGTDRQRAGAVLRTAVDAIAGLRVGFAPYLPFTSARLGPMLGLTEEIEAWAVPLVPDGARIGPVAPLFTKIPDALLEEEA